VTDHATPDHLHAILRREGRSLFQYLREAPPWVGPIDRNSLARIRELAGAESEIVESLSKLMQKHHGDYGHLGAFPDFTGYNDAALHFLLPMVIVEQKQLLKELETDRKSVTDADAAALLDQLLVLKRRHIPQLEDMQPAPHSFTTVNV
jgi:hypothetical protein